MRIIMDQEAAGGRLGLEARSRARYSVRQEVCGRDTFVDQQASISQVVIPDHG